VDGPLPSPVGQVKRRAARDFDHGADAVGDLGLLLLLHEGGDLVDDLDLEVEFLLEADERDHDSGLDGPPFLELVHHRRKQDIRGLSKSADRGNPMQTYRARNPRHSPLWQCAHRHFATFVETYPRNYQPRLGPLRPVIPQVVHKFLDCGNLDRGFARIRCDHCRKEYLLAFSCKSRWFCPSCHQKNVQTTAAFLTARILAPVPHRHYVLALPKMLRPYFQRQRHLLKCLCALAHQSLTEYLRAALDLPDAQPAIILTAGRTLPRPRPEIPRRPQTPPARTRPSPPLLETLRLQPPRR